MLEVHHGDVIDFSILGYTLYFQLGLVAIIVGMVMWRRAGKHDLSLRLPLLGSCAAFLWPLSCYRGAAAWKAGAPCLAIAVVALVPPAIYNAAARPLATVLLLAGIASASLMVFNDVFF